MPSARRSSQAAAAAASPKAIPTTTAATDAEPATTTATEAASAPAPTSAEAGPSNPAKQAPAQKEEASTDAHLELLTEHFGYNPKSFIDALVYLSNEHLYSIATEFENVVLDLLKDVDGGELEAEQGMHAILTLMENSLDHTLDTFELYCFRSVFGIRSRQAKYMTLDHHRGLDLRTQQSSASAASSKGQSKSARKSVVGASTNFSANERSYQLGETEDSLKRQIAAARATQHKLLLAQNATRESLDRMLRLAERFSSILYAGDRKNASAGSDVKTTAPVLTETLGQHARKLKADTIPLLRALQELRTADPLGAPLYSGGAGSGSREAGDGEAEEEGVEAADKRAWERGREGYLNWEADRIIAKSKRGGATGGSATGGVGAVGGGTDAEAAAQDVTLAPEDDSKTPKRKRTAGQPTSSKRKTPGTATRSRG
ncbi:Kinetochore-associated protein MTW1 [Pseudozyma hubeiensis]|nr:Kinetochore-associated protein MTW1 [Pseudozyma hubeiensis]